jgi:hypothetical protein
MAIETELQTKRQFIDFIEDDLKVAIDISDSKVDDQAISKFKVVNENQI